MFSMNFRTFRRMVSLKPRKIKLFLIFTLTLNLSPEFKYETLPSAIICITWKHQTVPCSTTETVTRFIRLFHAVLAFMNESSYAVITFITWDHIALQRDFSFAFSLIIF